MWCKCCVWWLLIHARLDTHKHGKWPPTPCSMQNTNGLRFPIPVPFTHFKVYLLLYPFRVSIHLSMYLPRRSFSLSCALQCRLEWKQRRKEIPNNSCPYHKTRKQLVIYGKHLPDSIIYKYKTNGAIAFDHPRDRNMTQRISFVICSNEARPHHQSLSPSLHDEDRHPPKKVDLSRKVRVKLIPNRERFSKKEWSSTSSVNLGKISTMLVSLLESIICFHLRSLVSQCAQVWLVW